MVKYYRLYMYNYIHLKACRDNDPRLFWGLSSNLGTAIFLEFGTMEGFVWLLNLESEINAFWDLRIRQLMELSFILFQRECNVDFCFTKGMDVVIQVFKWVVFFIIWSSMKAYDLFDKQTFRYWLNLLQKEIALKCKFNSWYSKES